MTGLLMYSLLGICIHARPFSPSMKGSSSISGEIRKEEQTKRVVCVSELSEGDVIFGIMGSQRKPAWCKVVAFFPAAADTNKITLDNFKTDHMVIVQPVHPFMKGNKRMGEVYTLVTDYNTSVNSARGAFSPTSASFCRLELSWKDYITMLSAVRRVFNHTGYFWFDTSGYSDKRTATVPHWFYKLHERHYHLLLCARDGPEYKSFEVLMETFAPEHRDKGYEEIVGLFFTNRSGDVEKQEGGTITALVGQHVENHTVPFIAVGSAIGVLLVIAVIIVLCGLRMMEKEEGKQDKEPFINEH